MVEVSFLIDRVFVSLYLIKDFNRYRVGSPLIALKVVPDINLVPQTGIVNVLFPAILSMREERLKKHPRTVFGRIASRKNVIRSRKKSN